MRAIGEITSIIGRVGETQSSIASAAGKHMIAARFATVEPVFGNLRHNKRLTRFTLRGRAKVDGQWKRYCIMHNIEKLAQALEVEPWTLLVPVTGQ